jgi:hypothetical protein
MCYSTYYVKKITYYSIYTVITVLYNIKFINLFKNKKKRVIITILIKIKFGKKKSVIAI